jgi:hypothetical protein
MSVERRRSSRIPFAPSAEIIDEAENTRSTSQVSDLSLHGCFVQLPNPLPEGTSATIEIYKGGGFCRNPSDGSLLHAQARNGVSVHRDRAAIRGHSEKVDLAIKSYRAPRVNSFAPFVIVLWSQ